MAFLLRAISHSADGREIVRTSTVKDDLLKIGRGPNCDVVLNDLAVALHHATIELIDEGHIGISAEMGMTVEIDGTATSFGRLALHAGGDLRVGPFILRVLPKPAGVEDVSIDIERGEDDAASEKADVNRFALASVMPGKRWMAWSFAIFILAFFLAWPIWSFYQGRTEAGRYAQAYHADRMWLSGTLSRGHASLGENCQACHVTPFVSVRDEACTACHVGIHDHADPARLAAAAPNLSGLRRLQMRVGRMFGQEPGRCVDCHTEHEGPQEIPPTPQQFCSDCHADLRGRLPDTRLANAGDFEDAHPEFQPLVLIDWTGEQPRLERVALNRNPRERSNLKFPHALHLDPRGGAAQMGRRLRGRYGFGDSLQCADCHVPTPDGTRFQPPSMEGDCGMCHSLAFDQIDGTIRTLRHGSPAQVVGDLRALYRAGGPQRPAELSPGARERPGDVAQIRAAVQNARARANVGTRADQAIRGVFSQGGACFDCHEVIQPTSPAGFDYGIRPVAFPTRYLLHGWFDHRDHRIVQRPGQPRLEGSAACASCHNAPASNSARDVLLPDIASCRTCHGGESTRLPVASTCAMCHDYHMDEGTPAMLLRQRVRGRRWETTVIPAHPTPAPGPAPAPARGR